MGPIQTVVEQIRELAKVKNNTLRYEYDQDFSVCVDYDRFVKSWWTLQNANQFTDNGKSSEGMEWRVKSNCWISDTGIGIDESEIKGNLGTFLQSGRFKKSTKYGESGLGLTIVKSLVDITSVNLCEEVKSAKGTTFRVVFPGESEL